MEEGENKIEKVEQDVIKAEPVWEKPAQDTGLSQLFASINNLAELTKLAQIIAASPVHAKMMKRGETEVTPEVVMSALILGNQAGLSIGESLLYGTELNKDSIMKISMGRTLGIPPMIALNHIHSIPSSAGTTTAVDYHIINSLMLKAGVQREILEDYKPISLFRMMNGGTVVEYDESKFFVFVEGMQPPEIKELRKNGREPVTFYKTTFRTTIKFTRGRNTGIFSYTTQDAIEAELMAGVKYNGDTVKGKNNWNLHPKTMLRKQVVSLSKEIIADILFGTVTTVEMGYDTPYDVE